MDQVRTVEITVSIHEHRNTGLLVATSSDLPGLVIAARSEEQIEHELPEAIREVLKARGEKIAHVTATRTLRREPDNFSRRSFVSSATLTPA